MADEYDYDVDDYGFDYDDGWMYVEDEYGLADELAEGQIPDPGHVGTSGEIEMESFEFDLYDYWDDIEYADDAYWDTDGRPPLAADSKAEKPGQKRKRGAPAKTAAVDKRRKVSATQRQASGEAVQKLPTVVYRSQTERYEMWNAPGPVQKSSTPYALLADWRTRYAKADSVLRVSAMPAAMRKAAEAQEEDTPPKARHQNAQGMLEDGDEGEWEADGEEGDGAGGLAGVDPEMLKAVLKQRLGEAGLEGVDEEAFMPSIGKMLAGEGGGDDATGELANMLLGRATESGGDGALSGWLSQQGVSLEEGEEDDASSVATTELPQASSATRGNGTGAQISPYDSAVGGLSSRIAIHPGSPQARQKKWSPKRVKFDVPQEEDEDADGDEQPEEESPPTLPASEVQPQAGGDVIKTAARASRSKAANHAAAKNNRVGHRAGGTKGMKASPDAQLQQELEEEVAVENAAAQHVQGTQQTRKRKAQDDGAADSAEGLANGGKRAAKEPATRSTRSARAKAGT